MIPPAAPALLSANPRFEKLHSRLSKDLLDQDASRRSSNVSLKATQDALESHRINNVRDGLLVASLFDVAQADDLPHDLKQVLLVVASYILDASGLGLTNEECELLTGDVKLFNESLPAVSVILSERLSSQHEMLRDVAVASNDASFQSKIPSLGVRAHARTRQRDRPPLHELVDNQTSHLAYLKNHTLPSTTYETINTLVSVLQSQAEHLHYSIRHLEQRKYGADVRHLAARAQWLSAVAHGLQAKTRVSYLEQRRDLYSPELVQKLRQRVHELDEEEERLEQKKKEVRGALAEYDEAGLDVMKALGKRYGEIEQEIREVKDDMGRLNKEKIG